MHFINSFSSALVSALLLTSTLGQLTQVHRRVNDERDLSTRGTSPSSSMLKYCNKAVPQKGKRDVEEVSLAARAPPTTLTPVAMGTFASSDITQGGLTSQDFGTCPGFVVTGTAAPKSQALPNGGPSRFLFHMSLGSGSTFQDFATAVQNAKNAGMKNLQGTFYTTDTRSTNSELKDPDVKQIADDVEIDYHSLEVQFENLCGKDKITREYHPFSKTGQLSVAASNHVTWT